MMERTTVYCAAVLALLLAAAVSLLISERRSPEPMRESWTIAWQFGVSHHWGVPVGGARTRDIHLARPKAFGAQRGRR